MLIGAVLLGTVSVPAQALLPKLRAKPVRTASGVSGWPNSHPPFCLCVSVSVSVFLCVCVCVSVCEFQCLSVYSLNHSTRTHNCSLRLTHPLRTLLTPLQHQIAVVAVMCKPHRCPHIAMTGNICVYCPGGPDSDFEYSTQSYTGYEVRFLLHNAKRQEGAEGIRNTKPRVCSQTHHHHHHHHHHNHLSLLLRTHNTHTTHTPMFCLPPPLVIADLHARNQGAVQSVSADPTPRRAAAAARAQR